MAWTNSKIFTSFIFACLGNVAAFDIDATDAIKAALFNDSITPSQTVAAAATAYAGGVWASGGITDTGTSAPAGWPSVGRPLVTPTTTAETVNPVMFDAADTVSANATTTLAATYGTLVYDDDVADKGLCYNYFGGSNSVTLGTFTIVWNASGIFAITL